MVLASLFPVFFLLLTGWVLRKYRLTSEDFLSVSNRLVYFIFFPAMLFWKIGGASGDGVEYRLFFAAILAVLLMFLISLAVIKLGGVSSYTAGSFSQTCYRFNTYIGMAVVVNALGDEGIRHFGLLVGFIIPVINMIAVSTLIWFSGEEVGIKKRFLYSLRAICVNPLILACIGGLIFSRSVNYFPPFIDNTLKLSSTVTLPLALISIGGSLTFSGLKKHGLLSFAAAAVKLCIFPAAGYFLMGWIGITGVPFRAGMIFFALPTSTAIYILSSQLNSDTEYASSAIMLSTILSFISLTAVLLIGMN